MSSEPLVFRLSRSSFAWRSSVFTRWRRLDVSSEARARRSESSERAYLSRGAEQDLVFELLRLGIEEPMKVGLFDLENARLLGRLLHLRERIADHLARRLVGLVIEVAAAHAHRHGGEGQRGGAWRSNT